MILCIYACGYHRDQHVLTHSFPTRRASYLSECWVRGGEAICRPTMERNRLREARVRRAPASHFEKVIRRDWSRLALVTLSPPERDRSARGSADVPLSTTLLHS